MSLFSSVRVDRRFGGIVAGRELVDESWYLLEGKDAYAVGCMHAACRALDGVGGTGCREVVDAVDVAGASPAATDRDEP